ncbi:MAG: hypothetical protein V7L00_11515 [Nostoc sp.]|uniref:hypothetical protein n=1 Tax=Nostoc sp. TaxID=1180 RepID=UPI002FFA92BF
MGDERAGGDGETFNSPLPLKEISKRRLYIRGIVVELEVVVDPPRHRRQKRRNQSSIEDYRWRPNVGRLG